MKIRFTLGRTIAALALCAIPLLAGPLAAQDWQTQQVKTATGYKVGNPQADTQLIEYVSYSCSHCANFEKQSHAALQSDFIRTGKVAVEIRHMIRNRLDLSAALLTQCGSSDKFLGNHNVMMLAQDEWLPKVEQASQEQRSDWQSGTFASQMRAIANDLGFYEIMQPRGYSRAQMDQCLGNEAQAQAIAELSGTNSQEYNVPGTPSFVVNGSLLDRVHSWSALEARLINATQ